jgi:hypothetical protein
LFRQLFRQTTLQVTVIEKNTIETTNDQEDSNEITILVVLVVPLLAA